MDIEKIVEIVESRGVINVTYNGNPVWIEGISKESNEVRVKNIKTNEEFMVSASKLKED
ncbi:H-type small acid-soluble spore protein [Clostridium aciditolerans]|uniref:H-type small acid-soluble spore protein n=1 Tax=Clostridium aciditolerans TaxID=339861 RepID=A0A934HZU5_9CLOT|nr:H-type small acid-soluble spore protein [Clostridium aciditolerans]MBI6872501.1 H-type small acid-soluble spore protein [Clostridium aciditolerans]